VIVTGKQMADSAKSDIKYPIAKRFLVVFAIVLLTGIVIEIAHQSDFGDLVFGLGLVGFLGSGLLALEKKSNVPKFPPTTGIGASVIKDIQSLVNDFLGMIGAALSVVLYIALALGLLWGLIAIVKWMWNNS
jgi:hypothetical protein